MNNNTQKSKELEEIKQLVENSLYKDAYDLAVSLFGNHKGWQDTQLILLARRCLNQLGHSRAADAIILHTRRRNQKNTDLGIVYLNVLNRRSGEYIALKETRQFRDSRNLTEKQHNKLTLIEASLLLSFRDFDSAEARLRSVASEIDPAELAMEYAMFYMAQDNYKEAHNHTIKAIKHDPNLLHAIRIKAHLLHMSNCAEEAIATLQAHRNNCQSVPLLTQLAYYLIQSREYDQAKQTITTLKNLFPFESKETQAISNGLHADLLCAQQNYEAALPFIEEQKGFWGSVGKNIRENRSRNNEKGKRHVLDVPFVRQAHKTCAPASITSVATYWQVDYTQDAIVEAICYDGTPAIDERHWLETENWHCVEFEMRFEAIKQLLDKGIPILLATVEPGSAHLQVLVGYDESMNSYLLRDPSHPRLTELLAEAAQQYYASNGPRCMVMIPRDKVPQLEGIHFEAKQLYDYYYAFAFAIDKQSRSEVYDAYKKLKELNQDHRLALCAKRELAMYDRDDVGELAALDLLLERYPDDINLQLRKIDLMSAIGSHTATLDYLARLENRLGQHYQIRSRFVAELRHDQRHHATVEKLFRKLLKAHSTDSRTLHEYASFLWNTERRTEAYELYRFLTCLEDKVEFYAENYFKAARFFRQTEDALAFLHNRHKKLSNLCQAPARSLYNALYNLDREQEGLAILEESIKADPHNTELTLFTAQQYMHLGRYQDAENLIVHAEPDANIVQILELRAELKEHQCERRTAIEIYRQLLAYDPLNRTANAAILRLELETGEKGKALKFINQQLTNFPGNYNLLKLKLSCLSNIDEDLPKRINVLQELLSQHPDDGWSYAELANSLLCKHEYDLALSFAQQSIARDPGSVHFHIQLGEVYFAREEFDQAKISFHKAIALSCDSTDAMDLLLQCVFDVESVRNELSFIKDQLLEQVSFGQGILHFHEIGSRWLTNNVLKEFLILAQQERPDLWQSWVALARYYRDNGDLENGLKTIDNAINRFPLLAVLHSEKADFHSLRSDYQKAESSLQESWTLSPRWTQTPQKLANIFEQQGEIKKAIDCINKGIHRDPNSAILHGYLADLLWKNNKPDLAILSIQKAVDLSPAYNWAWQQLHAWSQTQERDIDVLEQIRSRRKSQPNSESLLHIQVSLEIDPRTKASLLKKYVDANPFSQSVVVMAIDAFCELQDYDTALSLCENPRQTKTPSSPLRAAMARILRAQGKWEESICLIEEIVRDDHNFYEGWRQLALWSEEMDRNEQVVKALNECKRIHPNDASVLCFVAEKLQIHAPDDTITIVSMLQRAFQYQSNDRYIGLTYIDELIEHQRFDEALAAIERLSLFVNDSFVRARSLRVAGGLDQHQQVLKIWATLLLDPEVIEALAHHTWITIQKFKLEKEAVKVITDIRQSGQPINPLYGEYYAYHTIEQLGVKKFIKQLTQNIKTDPFEDRQLEAYLRTLLHQVRGLPNNLTDSIKERLQADLTNWGLCGNVHINNGNWHEAWEWLNHPENLSNAEPWMLYLASMAARSIGQWDAGIEEIKSAYEKHPDNYREDIQIWFVLDRQLAGKKVDMESMQWLNTENLADLNRYTFAIIKALDILDDQSFESAYEKVSPALRLCQKRNQAINNPVATNLKKRVRAHFKNTIVANNVFKRRFWLWRLSNHF